MLNVFFLFLLCLLGLYNRPSAPHDSNIRSGPTSCCDTRALNAWSFCKEAHSEANACFQCSKAKAMLSVCGKCSAVKSVEARCTAATCSLSSASSHKFK